MRVHENSMYSYYCQRKHNKKEKNSLSSVEFFYVYIMLLLLALEQLNFLY